MDFGYVTHKSTGVVATRGGTHKVADIIYADDDTLLSGEAQQAEEQLNVLSKNSAKVVLIINEKKTESMFENLPKDHAPPLMLNGKPIVIVKDFKYLGSHMESSEKDIKARIGLAWGAFNKLRAILKAPNNASETFKKFKLRLFKASCLSILLYGCETWILTPQLIKKLEVYQRDSYRIMMDINQHRDHMTNVELYKLVDQLPLGEMIRIRQLTFVGHCLRMTDNEEPIKKFILYESKVKPTNRPYTRKTYLDQISFYITHEKSTRANPTKLTK